VRFDLDGIAKGWLADRALARLATFSGAIVDADGDIALRVAPGDEVAVSVADPKSAARSIASIALRGGPVLPSTFGVATSGTSVHRWRHADGRRGHHLIDPRTRLPSDSDLVQATVVAGSAAVAEILAKAAVILGARAGLELLEQVGAVAAVIVTTDGESRAASFAPVAEAA
jgi:thiamine biosynthesis lipoprotein